MTPDEFLRRDLADLAKALLAAEQEAAAFLAAHKGQAQEIVRIARRLARSATWLETSAAWVVESQALVRTAK